MPFTLPQYTWDKDRELCKKCDHYEERFDHPRYNSGVVVMLCAVNPCKGRRGIGSCIDNRHRGPCGPAGLLFEPKRPLPDLAIHQSQPPRP